MKNKLFKLLFPQQFKEIEELKDNLEVQLAKVKTLSETPKATIADIMRDNLNLVRFDFGNVDAVQLMDHPINPSLPRETRESRLGELEHVFANQTFRKLCHYLINQQADLTLKKSVNDSEIYAGRFSINGISLLWNEMKKAHAQYEEVVKPPDSFDANEIINEI